MGLVGGPHPFDDLVGTAMTVAGALTVCLIGIWAVVAWIIDRRD